MGKTIVWIMAIIGGLLVVRAFAASPSTPTSSSSPIPIIETRTEQNEESIDFSTKTTKSNSLYVGETKVATKESKVKKS